MQRTAKKTCEVSGEDGDVGVCVCVCVCVVPTFDDVALCSASANTSSNTKGEEDAACTFVTSEI